MPIPNELKAYASKIGYPESETLARIFNILYDGPYDLKLIEAMPGTAKELSERTGIPQDKVAEATMQLLMQGALSVDFKKLDVLRLFPAMIELRDSSLLCKDVPQELYELWEKLVIEESGPMISDLMKKKIPPMVRVVPIERSVESQNAVLDIDSARKIFKDANLITVVPCVCREVARKNGRGKDCPAPETAVCMQTGIFASGVMARNVGEKITTEEALKRIGDAEDAGLVHCTRNNVQKDMFMCNCCSCCCTGFHFLQNLDYKYSLAPSRFRVKFDKEACSDCGQCEERCQFKAISMEDTMKVEYEKCYGCGNCVITCPEEALSLEEVRPKEHIRVKH